MTNRLIKRIVEGVNTSDGAGVRLHRVFAHDDVRQTDPFLLLDAFDSRNPADYVKGFPLHPHRGIETFTYLILGEMDHKDTLGNAGRIRSGEAQWMNSGRGIRHEEMPVASERLFGLQLWINLPQCHKMSEPTYHDILATDMPVLDENDATVRVVAGRYKDAVGAQGKYVQPLILDVDMKSHAELSFFVPKTDTTIVYVLEGNGEFGRPIQTVKKQEAAVFGDGDLLHAKATEKGMRFVLFSGKPLHDPIAWGGPIVMNTQEELDEAFRQLRDGTFIETPGT